MEQISQIVKPIIIKNNMTQITPFQIQEISEEVTVIKIRIYP